MPNLFEHFSTAAIHKRVVLAVIPERVGATFFTPSQRVKKRLKKNSE